MSTVHPSQIAAIVADLGVRAMISQYDEVPLVHPELFEMFDLSPISPELGFSEVVIAGPVIPERTLRGEPAKAGTVEQVAQWYCRIDKFQRSIGILEEEYNNPNANNIIIGRIQGAMGGWGSGWATAQEERAARLYNKGAYTAGDLEAFDGTDEARARVDPYPTKIYDNKPWFAASGNGHPLEKMASVTKHNAIASAALTSANLETGRILMEDTNARDETNRRIAIRPDLLIVPPALAQTASVLLESTLKPGTAQNDVNTHRGILSPIVWRYLDDSDAWFLSQRKKGKRFYSSGRIMRTSVSQPDPNTGTITIRGVGYMGAVVTNWRYDQSNNEATS